MVIAAFLSQSRRFSKQIPAVCSRAFSFTLPKSHSPSFPNTSTKTVTEHASVTPLLTSVEEVIQLAPSHTGSFVFHRLSEERYKTPLNRHTFFERLISLLIHYRHFEEAGSTYARMMGEGYVSSLKTDAQMLAIGLVVSPHQSRAAWYSLRLIFANEDYSEDDLILLLGVFQFLDAPPSFMTQVIRDFMSARGENYVPHRRLINILTGMLVKEGQIQEAFELANDYDNPSAQGSRSHPYASIISSIDSFDPHSQQSIGEVLETVREKEIEYDASIFNALLAHQVRLKDVDKAFTIYRTLMDATEQGFTSPDHYTFRNLFKLIGRSPLTSTLPMSPRKLFRDMVDVVFVRRKDRTPRCSIDHAHSLMIQSLLAFVMRRDYAAAYYVTKFVAMVGLPVSAQVYHTVIQAITSLIMKDIFRAPKTGGSPWMHRLLGLSRSDFEGMKAFRARTPIILELLRQSKRSGFLLDPASAPLPSRIRRQYMVPTLPMMKSRYEVPLRLLFDITPLQRILRRALLAHLEQEKDVVFGTAPEARQATGELIAAAETEMMSETVKLMKYDPKEYFTKRIKL
ncbi:hypothetical protein D9758_000781 [Tetrapyrgos nigripes]|uniref:Pentatricopeptide repeat-containing protein n=1 Tax=Tetrapyrgos nigripes TaxID=182062 RepID=A0A8H5GYM9_9AGAR|nr:hypothetical protein D9758_000781 [Tetrapyrgos nigripes]